MRWRRRTELRRRLERISPKKNPEALLILGDLGPNDPLRCHQRFPTHWRYITGYPIDRGHGGRYAGGIDGQPAKRRALEGHIWKAAHHDGGAPMNVSRRLAQPGGAP